MEEVEVVVVDCSGVKGRGRGEAATRGRLKSDRNNVAHTRDRTLTTSGTTRTTVGDVIKL